MTTYTRKPCRKCGGTEFYIVGNRCISCAANYRHSHADRLRTLGDKWRKANPHKPAAKDQGWLLQHWNKHNLQRIAELDTLIASSSGIVVFSMYARAV